MTSQGLSWFFLNSSEGYKLHDPKALFEQIAQFFHPKDINYQKQFVRSHEIGLTLQAAYLLSIP